METGSAGDLDEQVSRELARLSFRRAPAADLEALRKKLRQIEIGIDELDIKLPEFRVPEPMASGVELPALVSSEMPLARRDSRAAGAQAVCGGGGMNPRIPL